MRFLCTVLILSLVLVASRASAQTNPEFDFVLVPVFTADSPGAFGSLWRTELALFNSGDGPVAVRPLECLFPCGGHVTYAAGTGDRLTPFTYTARPGRLLWVEKSRVSDVRFSLRVKDLSRQASSAGIDVPIVRSNTISLSPVTLLDVPTDARFRHSLRIYDVAEHSEAIARIRIYPFPANQGDDALADFLITLSDDPRVVTRPYRNVPAQAVINNLIADRPELRTFDSVRIDVEPVTTGMRLWAFVSITNNTTQEFTTVTPQ